MAGKEHNEELSEEELAEQNGELLPDREEMTLIQPIERIAGGDILPVEPPTTSTE